MSRPCAVCISPKREEIDSLLVSGTTNKAVAESTGLSVGQLSRHKRRCLAVTLPSIADQVITWSDRAETLWALSAQNGDQRAMVAALQTGLKSLEFQIKRQEEQSEEPPDSSNLPANFRDWPAWACTVVRKYLDSVIENVEMPRSSWTRPPEEPERRVIARVPLLPHRN